MPELDIQGILEQLGAADVAYVVIGGIAVGFHGYVRATKDLDIVPAPDRQNLDRLVIWRIWSDCATLAANRERD